MNRSMIALAALAISAHAFAAAPTPHATSTLPNTQASKSNPNHGPAIPTMTSAKFVKSDVFPGELVDVKFDGINLVKNTLFDSCNVEGHWPAEFHQNPNLLLSAARDGAWLLYSHNSSFIGNVLAPNLPGTYVVSFFPQGAGSFGGPFHPCTANGPITATLVVKKPPLLPTAAQ